MRGVVSGRSLLVQQCRTGRGCMARRQSYDALLVHLTSRERWYVEACLHDCHRIVVEDRRHILRRELVRRVANQEAGLANRTVADNHTPAHKCTVSRPLYPWLTQLLNACTSHSTIPQFLDLEVVRDVSTVDQQMFSSGHGGSVERGWGISYLIVATTIVIYCPASTRRYSSLSPLPVVAC